MNNTHQELIAEKVAEFANQHPKGLAEILTFFEKALQDTIDTVLKEERERVGKRYITLMNQAIGDTKLPEDVWKKIAKVNQLILDI